MRINEASPTASRAGSAQQRERLVRARDRSAIATRQQTPQ
jgi:hypothetical protein